ncbi:MAG: pentapeptide repeat-containing protein [Anaerolineae bacterium]|nr:pentapeptide repeat-containing protein [Anaerolineae bacterium]
MGKANKKQPHKANKRLKKLIAGLTKDPVNLIVFIFAIVLLIFGIIISPRSWGDAKANLSAELIGMAITVLVLDRLYAYRDGQREKKRTILQMASPSNDFALQAVRVADDERWLIDGSLRASNLSLGNLKGAILWGAKLEGARLYLTNLENANLRQCQFQNARLTKANMKNCDLREANLSGAILDDVDLTSANLEGANLERANLSGAILAKANLKGVNLENSTLLNTNLNGAIIDSKTKLPNRMDIKKNRLIFQETRFENKKRPTKRVAS